MRYTEVAIVGGGLAGSATAAMLGRAGIDAVLIDPRPTYPPDFRCEKLDESQIALLNATGLADLVLPAATANTEVWVARFGRLVEKRRHSQFDILYPTLVNAVRAAVPAAVPFVEEKARAFSTGPDRQVVTLSNGEEISARLIVLANGLNSPLRDAIGIRREELSPCHSISIGFDVAPVGRDRFPFQALTYNPERATDRMAYLALFPIGSTMRASLFVYRDMHDPWLSALRHTPTDALAAVMPGLRRLAGEFAVPGFVKIRPVDLYVSRNVERPGLVLVGDAFATSCPAAGTGVNKVLTDVLQLCSVHIPRWLASPGMEEAKLAEFYADPVKLASDAHSLAKAYRLRALSTETGLAWSARRWGRFAAQLGRGAFHRRRGDRSSGLPATAATH